MSSGTPDAGACPAGDPWRAPPIAWFRPSIRREVWRHWALASLWVTIGAACLGVLRMMGVDFGSPWLLAYAVGLGFVTAGPWQLFVGLARVARVERVLSLHDEGVRWQDGALVAHIAWHALEAVEVGHETITLRSGKTRVEIAGEMDEIDRPALASMLMQMRRKALMGLRLRATRGHDRTYFRDVD